MRNHVKLPLNKMVAIVIVFRSVILLRCNNEISEIVYQTKPGMNQSFTHAV
jgi:hypothetical protein